MAHRSSWASRCLPGPLSPPVVLARSHQLACSAAFVFVIWLFTQSVFSLSTLCPWCMVVWAVTIPLRVSASRLSQFGDIPASERTLLPFQQLASWSWGDDPGDRPGSSRSSLSCTDWFGVVIARPSPQPRRRPATPVAREPRPQCVNLRERVSLSSGGVDDHVGDRAPFLGGGLLRDPAARHPSRHAAQLHHAGDPHLLGASATTTRLNPARPVSATADPYTMSPSGLRPAPRVTAAAYNRATSGCTILFRSQRRGVLERRSPRAPRGRAPAAVRIRSAPKRWPPREARRAQTHRVTW